MIKRQAGITGGCASNFVSYLLLLVVLPIRSILTLFALLSMPGSFHRDGGHHEEASLEPCGGGGNEVRTIIATP